MLSAGGIRQHFTLHENVLMSNYAAKFLQDYMKKNEKGENTAGIAFHQNDYTFLASTSEEQKKILEANNTMQRSCGVDWVHLSDTNVLSKEILWLNTEDLAFGSYSNNVKGTNEGYFDPLSLMHCMKREAVDFLGRVFVEANIEQVKCIRANEGSIGDSQD